MGQPLNPSPLREPPTNSAFAGWPSRSRSGERSGQRCQPRYQVAAWQPRTLCSLSCRTANWPGGDPRGRSSRPVHVPAHQDQCIVPLAPQTLSRSSVLDAAHALWIIDGADRLERQRRRYPRSAVSSYCRIRRGPSELRFNRCWPSRRHGVITE
jgi:hypothetical protein